jgi:23S rRNA (uracil1939-C5)-methyltransferase
MKNEITVKKNENYIMDIDDTGSIGEGIGKIDGFTMFVEGAVAGDKVEIKAVKLKNNYGYGKLLNIIEPSPNRIEPVCSHSQRCGGCQLQNYNYEAQLKLKQKKVQDSIERIGKLEGISVLPTIGMDNHWNYRNKAQFPVGMKNGKLLCAKNTYNSGYGNLPYSTYHQ